MTKENRVHTGRVDEEQICRMYIPVFERIKKMMYKNDPLVIAVEGRCGSGKSTLAELLEEKFECNVFHMDDFFLPFEMRTKERLAEPGGNVHYERFRSEVLQNLQKRESVTFRPYNCAEGTLSDPIYVEFKPLSIVEGSYSMHPVLQQAYNYSIFLTLNHKKQIERIRRRNGEERLQSFINQWIPMEEQYFSTLRVQEHCDLIIDTDIGKC